jgi:hypothetical protein
MKLKVQLMVCDDDGHEETFTDLVVLEKACQRIEHLGLTLTEAKQILTVLQQRLVELDFGHLNRQEGGMSFKIAELFQSSCDRRRTCHATPARSDHTNIAQFIAVCRSVKK